MTMMEENPVLWAENLDVYQKKTRVLSEVNFSILIFVVLTAAEYSREHKHRQKRGQ